jgi:glucose-6-phosphate 1-dehydrogenase
VSTISNSTTANPLRETVESRQRPQPCSLVIFGATGDLTHRKLIPALYNIAMDGELPPALAVVGFARRDKTDEVFRDELKEALQKFSRQGFNEELWNSFSSAVYYHRSEFSHDEGYVELKKRLDELDQKHGTRGNRLFYLAVSPDQFEPILERLNSSGLNKAAPGSWARVIVEKPFGTDLPSAQLLNELVRNTFPESATYRIDHFLGKETAQNIMVLRFANAIFEPLWNSRYIEQVQITAAETLGMEGGRAGYYDKSGALRDMVQNHLLQLLCLVAMEPPTDLSADSIRDEKVKVLRSLRRLVGEAVGQNVIRANYTAGAINGKDVPGYLQEDRVPPESTTETYVALKLNVDNWRWSGVPFYVRVGKRLPKSGTEISVHFKTPPSVLLNKEAQQEESNVLVIRIQPDEGVSLRMQAKVPGVTMRIEPVKMDFRYGTSFGKASPEAYERLLLDAMAGDATLFARRDEVEQAWSFVDEIQHWWASQKDSSTKDLTYYEAGSWGPEAAENLLAKDGHTWRRF